MSEATDPEKWVAFHTATDEPITCSGNIGVYYPVWNNPMSAHEWAQAQSKKTEYYVREVEVLFLAKRE